MELKPLSPLPTGRDLISHTLRSEGEYPRRKWIAVLEYPDCTREYDGQNWRVVADKRKGA